MSITELIHQLEQQLLVNGDIEVKVQRRAGWSERADILGVRLRGNSATTEVPFVDVVLV